MNKFVLIFLIFTCSFSFAQEEKKIIDDFYLGIDFGIGNFQTSYYTLSSTPIKIEGTRRILALPKTTLEYRNKHLLLSINFVNLIKLKSSYFANSYEPFIGPWGKPVYITNIEVGANFLSLFKTKNKTNLFLGPKIGYSNLLRKYRAPIHSFILGGVFHYKILYLGITCNFFLSQVDKTGTCDTNNCNDRMWLVNIGVRLNTGMFRKK